MLAAALLVLAATAAPMDSVRVPLLPPRPKVHVTYDGPGLRDPVPLPWTLLSPVALALDIEMAHRLAAPSCNTIWHLELWRHVTMTVDSGGTWPNGQGLGLYLANGKMRGVARRFLLLNGPANVTVLGHAPVYIGPGTYSAYIDIYPAERAMSDSIARVMVGMIEFY